jgi:capsular polysaccharide biosynthesis protein
MAGMTASLDLASTNGSHHDLSTTEDAADDYLGATISLRMLRAAARRRWRTWVLLAIVGLLLGASLRLVLPKTYSAVTQLYLFEPATAPASEEMANDLDLLQTPGVAKTVLANLPAGLEGTKESYRGLALTNNVLAITSKASSPAAAVALGNTVASVFLAARQAALQQSTNAQIAGIEQQIKFVGADLASVEAQILKATQKQLGPLISQENTDHSTIGTLKSEQGQAYRDQTNAIKGSRVFNSATASKSKTKKATIEDGLSGLIAGLALGLGIVVVGEIVSDRLRWRADIARALGVPVELSVGHYRRSRLLRSTRMHWRLKRPSRTLVMMERRLRARLQASPHHALAVIALEAAEPAALAVASLARSLTADGMRTVVVDMADGRPLAAVFGISKRGETAHSIEIAGRPATLIVSPPDPAQMGLEVDPAEVDAVLVLASADPWFGADHIAAWAGEAVVVIAAGEVSASRIRGTSQMLRQAGIALKSAIIVDTDRADDSVGVVGPGPAYWGGEPALEALPPTSW